jgi:hypothetical protein
MCRVGNGDGIGARRTGTTTPCVERAGVDVRERETVARRVFGRVFGAFALARLEVRFLDGLAGFAALATGRRDGRRALPLTLRRDAAFNCIPLLWIRDSGMWGIPANPCCDGDISVAGRRGHPKALFSCIGPER